MQQSNQKYLCEKDLYNKINKFRKDLETLSLTSGGIKKFIDKNPEYDSNPEIVLKHSILGNICSWNSYEIACIYNKAIQASIFRNIR